MEAKLYLRFPVFLGLVLTLLFFGVDAGPGAACYLPADYGKCDGLFIRWHFDIYSARCHQFYYSGCGGNVNNFVTAGQCVIFGRQCLGIDPSLGAGVGSGDVKITKEITIQKI